MWIVAGSAITSGHLPRSLELVQFLSIYCTSLSSKQQTRVSDFQMASFTHFASPKSDYCGVCPGFCTRPSVLVLPTFLLIICLLSLVFVVVVVDVYKSRNLASPIQDSLLGSGSASGAVAADGRFSLRHAIAAACVRYFRGLIETCSSYVLMPCTFVLVLNVRPSSFDQANSSDRAMIAMLPVLALLLRALVIRQRVVRLTAADQKLLFIGSVCSCLIAAALSVYFDRAGQDARQSAPLFGSDTSPQYIVLALLVGQIIAQTVVRLRASEESIYDNVDWPWSPANSHASSAVFAFDELKTRLVVGSIKRSSSAAAITAAKFFMLNYVAISQMAMVTAGLASARATSALGIETSSVVIGSIPLITSAVLLLHNATKLVKLLWRKFCRRQMETGPRRSSNDSIY
jgi:hypothetical protein